MAEKCVASVHLCFFIWSFAVVDGLLSTPAMTLWPGNARKLPPKLEGVLSLLPLPLKIGSAEPLKGI